MRLRTRSQAFCSQSFMWLVPFVCVFLVVLSMVRPRPEFRLPAHYRIVEDAAGTAVPIEIPYHGSLTVPWEWGSHASFERLFGSNYSAYVGYKPTVLWQLRRVGLPAVYLTWITKDWDDWLFSEARISSVLEEHPERAEALINQYHQAYLDLEDELHTKTLTDWPRILIVGSSTGFRERLYVKSERNDYRIYLPPAEVLNAARGWTGEAPEAERILAMDPDYIFLMHYGQSPKEFMDDPRWLGLKAVQEKRVYRFNGGLMGLIYQPIWVRWMAEIVHPDRLQPETRQVLRNTVLRELEERMSDDEIDTYLYLDANKD